MDTEEHERLPNITLRHETAHVLLFNISQSQYSFSKSYLQKEVFSVQRGWHSPTTTVMHSVL